MGLFITFEGGEGSGKSTQAKILASTLKAKGLNVTLTHEPGGTQLGNQLRNILLNQPDKNYVVDSRALVLGFCASRAQLISEIIIPALQEPNSIVISDRFSDSTIAYQVFGGGLQEKKQEVEEILKFATQNMKPDLTIFLDISVKIGLQRVQGRIKKTNLPYEFGNSQQLSFVDANTFDGKEIDFHKAVKRGYEWLIKREPSRWYVLSADGPMEELSGKIYEKVYSLLKSKQFDF